jgi:hypothetical protein
MNENFFTTLYSKKYSVKEFLKIVDQRLKNKRKHLK